MISAKYLIALVVLNAGSAATAATDHSVEASDGIWSVRGQATIVDQYHPAFAASYSGGNSLNRSSNGRETLDATLFLGVRLWDGGEAYANAEIDQGFGLSNTAGVAGFPSGEAYKVGKSSPYGRLQRLFFRQSFDLGGQQEMVESGPNQLGSSRAASYIVLTGGKISPTDIFDANSYAHDPKSDFLNWAIIDSGAFDYAADSWGYSYGMVGEWNQDWWTLRTGLFNLSRIPNTTQLERNFTQFEIVGEGEVRHTLLGAPGKIKLLGFLNRGRMGRYDDALRLGVTSGTVPDTALVRRYASRPGGAINIEQQVTHDFGSFLRLSLNDGSKEAYEFTEVNRSLALGVSLKGMSWERPDDSWGFAGVVNDITGSTKAYLAAGGLGILIGDGQLRRYGTENIAETYYSFAVTRQIAVSADYQLIVNPAYNQDRGPVSVLGVRLHGQF